MKKNYSPINFSPNNFEKRKRLILFLPTLFIFLLSPSIYGAESQENIADTLEKKSTDELVRQIIEKTTKVRTVVLKDTIAVSENFINLADFFNGEPFAGIAIDFSLKEGHNYFSKKDILHLMQKNKLVSEKIRIDGKGISVQYYPTNKNSSQNYAEVWCLCYGKDALNKKYVLLEGGEENKRILSNDIKQYVGKQISIIQKSGPILIQRNAKLLAVEEGSSLLLAYQGKEKDDSTVIGWNTVDF